MSISRMRLRGALGQAGTIAVTLLGLLLLTFVIGRMMPADPVRAIVGEEASPEIYQQVFQQLQRIYIQIVGRLIKHQHIGWPRKQPRQQQAVALTARE